MTQQLRADLGERAGVCLCVCLCIYMYICVWVYYAHIYVTITKEIEAMYLKERVELAIHENV